MAPDIEQHGTGLLELLHDDSDAAVATYLSEHGLSLRDGIVLVEYLSDHGLVRDVSTFGGPDANITAQGIARVQQLRTERQSPARRVATLRTRMLMWLDHQEQQEIGIDDWSQFLASPNVDYYGTPFSKQELAREAEYLKQHDLITGIDVGDMRQATPGMIRPKLTGSGRDCVIDFGGNVSDYLNRGRSGGNTTNITMTDSAGNITVASENVVQNVNSGLDTTKLLDFAGFVRQTLPTLGLPTNQQDTLDTQAGELHHEADSPTPDRSKLRRLLDAILEGLGAAAPTVVQSTAIGLGEEALKAITGA